MLMHQGLLLVLASAWLNEVNKESLIAEIERLVGRQFANELAALREGFTVHSDTNCVDHL